MKDNSNFGKGSLVRDFTSGNITKQMVTFAAPLFLSSLLQIVYNMVDMVVVGQVLGSPGLSAVSVGGDVTNLLTFLVMGFSNAGQVIISQYIGANQKDKVGKFIGTMFSFLMLAAVILSVVCLCFRSTILRWMNTPEEAWDEAMAYATTCIIGLVFIYGYNMVSAVLRGMGDSKHPCIIIATASVINLALDLLFVWGMHMGAFGAALATVIGQTVSFLFAVVFLYKNHAQFDLTIDLSCFRIDRSMLGVLVALGLPMAIKSAAVSFSKLFVNSWINSYGVVVSAVAGIGSKINSIANLFSNSLNTAGSSMVGQNIGAEKYDRVPRILWCVFGINVIISAVLSAAILLFPRTIFSFFTPDTEVLDVAMQFVPVAVLIFIGCVLRSTMNALINGCGNYRINFAVAILDGVVLRIGLALLLGLVCDMKYMGFWYGDAIASFTPFVIGIFYYMSGSWKTRKYVIRD